MTWLTATSLRLGWAVAVCVFVVDQAHKWWMLLGYRIAEKGRVAVTPFLDLVYVVNPGVSYSLFPQSDRRGQYMLSAFAVLAALALSVWLVRGAVNRLLAASIGLIIGGALGNALDRILIGGVADFFSLHAFGFYWYVFNIADVAIVAGVVGLLYDSYWPSRGAATKST